VIRARLADAQFFYRSDVDVSFIPWLEKLHGVLFQAKLGSMHAKVARLQQLAEVVAASVIEQKQSDAALKAHASRAALLCKADLVSQVVVEFPKLQGIMGRVYAGVAGEPADVAAAIEEHYRPTRSGGALPQTACGSIVSIADKVDSICGCFSVDLKPTGASDPYALRRQGIGIVQIMLAQNLSLSLRALIAKSLSLFAAQRDFTEADVAEEVYTFIKNRIAHLLAEEGFSKDVVSAVVEVSVDHIPHTWRRVRALEALKARPDFESLVIGFKRVVNIIKKAGYAVDGDATAAIDTSLFQHASEGALYKAYQTLDAKVKDKLVQGQFEQALLDIASLKDTVDSFFDDVMVMTDDLQVRENRLALLGRIAALFSRLADFSRLTT
jgi:glycyl-tRNA synthetase beta chain